MKATVVITGNKVNILRGLLDEKEWTKVKRNIAEEQIKKIRDRAPKCDEDPQVNWNFRRDWRKDPLPVGTSFGSDFDYWNYVVNDAFELWKQFAPLIMTPQYHDYVAEGKAGWPKYESGQFYANGEDAFAVWENGVKVNRTHNFHGPQIDLGPTADFSVFLERWDFSQKRPPILNAVRGVGVMETITRILQIKYDGVHTIFKFPIRPDLRETREIPRRKEPIVTLPLVRVLPRHFLRKR